MQVNQTNFTNQSISTLLTQKTNKTTTSNTSTLEELIDSFEQGEESNGSATYSNKLTMDSAALTQLLNESDDVTSSVQSMIKDLLERQGLTVDQLKSGQVDNVTVDDIAQKKAQEMIGPGGEFSPEKVSDRIVDFAIAAFGGNKDKIEIIRQSIDQGFAQARSKWGGELPDITNETYDLIQQKLDKWVNGDNTTTTESQTTES